MNLNRKSSIAVLGTVLCLICALSAAIMAFASAVTEKPIAEAQSKRLIQAFRQVLPAFDNEIGGTERKFRTSSGEQVLVYTARKNGAVVGYALRVSSTGYGGRIEGLVGLNPEGKILNFLITSHSETPGLGSRACDRMRRRTIFDLFRTSKAETEENALPPNKLLDSFRDHGAQAGDPWGRGPWQVQKDGGQVDAVTGATISSRAVTRMAWSAAACFQENRQILAGGK